MASRAESRLRIPNTESEANRIPSTHAKYSSRVADDTLLRGYLQEIGEDIEGLLLHTGKLARLRSDIHDAL